MRELKNNKSHPENVKAPQPGRTNLRRALLIGLAIALMTAVAFVSTGASAEQDGTEVVLIVPDETEPTIALPYRTVSAVTGAPVALYQVNFPVEGETPRMMAEQYLRGNADKLHLRSAALSDLVYKTSSMTLSGTVVRFRQLYDGILVYKGEIAVHINRENVVTFVSNAYKSDISLTDTKSDISAAEAQQLAHDYLDVREPIYYDRTALTVYHIAGQSRLAYQVRVEAFSPQGSWEVLVDANNGEIFKAQDEAYYNVIFEENTDTSKTLNNLVDGTGNVFDPDPLTSATAVYGDPGFVDGDDATTTQLDGERFLVNLLDIQFSGGMYTLIGPYAEIQDFEGPFYGLFPQASDAFLYNRFDNAFEAANTYYHIDSSMRYINETLGITLMPFQYSGGVRFDAHGLNGADNSHYLSGTGQVAFGEGGVDDAEDSDVIHHELGHGLHDWVTNGSLSQVEGLSEGTGDFWAQSYNRSIDSWTPIDPEYNWVFRWDGHNPFWPGRVTNYFGHYPEDLTGSIHTDGQIWSTAMMKVWDAIGKTKTDVALWEGLAMTISSTSQDGAANAVFQAGIDLGYSTDDLLAMRDVFIATGYNIDPLPVPDFDLQADPTELAVCTPTDAVYSVQVLSQFDFSEIVTLSLSGEPASTTVSFFPNAMAAPYTSTLTVGNTGAATAGQYSMDITGVSPTATHTTTVGLGLFDGNPGTVTLTTPTDGDSDISLKPLFSWTAANQGYTYIIEVDDDPGFGSLDYAATVIGTTQRKPRTALEPLTTYYWRVRPENPCGSGANSAVFSFTTGEYLKLLLVDDDDNNPPEVPGIYTAALDALRGPGSYDIWDTDNSDNEPDAATLSAYDVVIWFTGDEFGGFAGPGDAGEADLSTWLDIGGCFFISAQDYYYDRGPIPTPFMSNYLGVSSATSDISQTTVTGQGSIFGGLGPYVLNYPFSNWSDVINPDGTAEVAFLGDIGNAAVNKQGTTYATAFLGFPWEAIPTAGDREEVFTTFFDWCSGDAAPSISTSPSSIDETMMVNTTMSNTLTIENVGTGDLEWTIDEAVGGNCASTGDITWVTLSDASGTTGAGSSTEVVVTFDAGGLETGNYSGALCIDSNDAAMPTVTLPVSMLVEWYDSYLPVLIKT
jgi:hypothetical protein